MSISVCSRAGILAQLGLVVVTLGIVSVAPPARGAFLLVPLTETAARDVARLAIERDARLIGPGRFGGSLVVQGERGHLLAPMLRRGVMTVAAASFLCGARGNG